MADERQDVAEDPVTATELDNSSGWREKLGITDRDTGRDRGRLAFQMVDDYGNRVITGAAKTWTTELLVFAGMFTRARGIHSGILTALDADNPYATFPLLRCYAENAAGLLYQKDHPDELGKFLTDRDGISVPIRKVNRYAEERFIGYRPIYAELCRYAHPHALSVIASSRSSGGTSFQWSSVPTFSDSDLLTAYGWLVELAQSHASLFGEYADAYRLRRAATSPR